MGIETNRPDILGEANKSLADSGCKSLPVARQQAQQAADAPNIDEQVVINTKRLDALEATYGAIGDLLERFIQDHRHEW